MDLSPHSASTWLNAHGIATSALRCRSLGGGVSNVVLLVESEDYNAVLKQSLARLRVEKEWLSERSRIFREADAMRWLSQPDQAQRLRGGRIPALLLEDRDQFAIAMEAAPPDASMWKTLLFSGIANPSHAHAAGALLGSLIAVSWNHPEARRLFGDQTVFHQLRIDPYYRFTASQHPAHQIYFENLIAESASRAVSLVHGDWSPKNLLFSGAHSDSRLWAIDWEVVHFGDPSFDAAFLLNHLLLKSIALPHLKPDLARLAQRFFAALNAELPPEALWIEAAALRHLPALLLARVDGKSPAEYLDEPGRQRARTLAFSFLDQLPRTPTEVFHR